MCDSTSLPLGTPVCALCSVVARGEEKQCFPESVGLLIRFEHARAGKRHVLLVGEKRKSPLQFQSVAVGLAGDWLDFAFLRVRECLRGETV